jgi:competence protein ComEA
MKLNWLPVVAVIVLVASVATAPAAAADTPAKGVVNINTATAQQLQLLPRIGPSTAERIIDFRTANGPFKKVDELLAVRGIGEKSMANLRPYVVTDGKTTLTEKVRLPRSNGSKAGG